MSRPPDEATGWTLVRLSQVPLATRLNVANRIVRVEGLIGVPMLDILIAATEPVQDPAVLVRDEVARKVCGL